MLVNSSKRNLFAPIFSSVPKLLIRRLYFVSPLIITEAFSCPMGALTVCVWGQLTPAERAGVDGRWSTARGNNTAAGHLLPISIQQSEKHLPKDWCLPISQDCVGWCFYPWEERVLNVPTIAWILLSQWDYALVPWIFNAVSSAFCVLRPFNSNYCMCFVWLVLYLAGLNP